ncbi:hypothetical protein LEO2_4 [Bacillus phage Leo2]|uniref:Uncharacterized protein n=1 Tax=Bacillus phage Leo2 TaxID=1815973 RepID=A0A1S5QTL8_9CAUD|nr:hypothetical protein LEO2_4 [Bacillus phage Leo2]
MSLTKLFISRDCYGKINKETGKVDCAAFRDKKQLGVSDIDNKLGASMVQLFEDDIPILVDPTSAYNVSEEVDEYDGDTFEIYWFKDGVEVELA